jgi:hypothetical protein
MNYFQVNNEVINLADSCTRGFRKKIQGPKLKVGRVNYGVLKCKFASNAEQTPPAPPGGGVFNWAAVKTLTSVYRRWKFHLWGAVCGPISPGNATITSNSQAWGCYFTGRWPSSADRSEPPGVLSVYVLRGWLRTTRKMTLWVPRRTP